MTFPFLTEFRVQEVVQLQQDDLCMMIANQYYQPIFRYCYGQLDCNADAAKDCTQEVFLILIQKKRHLNLGGNIKTWLYKTADRVMWNYRRKEKKYKNQISIDDIELIDDSSFSKLELESMLSCLTEEEYTLLMEYYNASYGERAALAQQHGMSLGALYIEVNRIRNKVKINNQ